MGKSTAAELLAKRGAKVSDSDQLARELVEPGQPALAEIAGAFGDDVLREDGSLDRAKMAALVRQGLARITGVGRTMATEPGLEKLEEMARPPRRDRDDDSSYGRDRDSRDSRGPSRTPGRDDHGAPSGPRRRDR